MTRCLDRLHAGARCKGAEVGARPARDRRWQQRRRSACRNRIAQARAVGGEASGNTGARAARGVIRRGVEAVRRIAPEAEKADQRIVVDIGARTRGRGQRGRDVEARLAEHRVIGVDAILLGQPQRAG